MADEPMAQTGREAAEADTPTGTLTLLLMYAGLIVLMWGYIYFALVQQRG